MKKLILLILITVLASTVCFTQDIIILKNTNEIKCKVVEIGNEEVKYKKFENQEGPIYNINKSGTFYSGLGLGYINGKISISDDQYYYSGNFTGLSYQVDLNRSTSIII